MPLAPNIQVLLETIIGALAGLSKSIDGIPRKYAALFMDLPSPVDYPDYYVYIQQPKSINQVLTSMRTDKYDSPSEVAHDLFLIWKNARQYNQIGSLVYTDAEKLETCMQDLWNGRSPPLPSWRKLPRPGEVPAGEKKKHKKKHRSEEKSKSSKSSHSSSNIVSLPITATPVPASYSSYIAPTATTSTSIFPKLVVKPRAIPPPPLPPFLHPIASTSTLPPAPLPTPAPLPVAQRVTFAAPTPLPPSIPLTTSFKIKLSIPTPSIQAPVQLPFPPIVSTPFDPNNLPKKELRKDFRIRQKLEKAQRVAAGIPEPMKIPTATVGAGNVAGVGAVAGAGTGVAILGEVKLASDVESGWFSGIPVHEQTSKFLEILNILQTKLSFDARILAIPLIAAPSPEARPDYYEMVKSPISLEIMRSRVQEGKYSNEKAFDKDLHQLFTVAKMFIRVDSPGNFYSDLLILQRLYHELTRSISTSLPTPAPVLNYGWTTSVDGTMIPPPIIGLADRTFLENVRFKGQRYKIGDWIHLSSANTPAKPIIGQIFKIWKKSTDGTRGLTVCVYLRPGETKHDSSREFYEGEVFKTSEFKDCAVEDILERCLVLPHHLYILGRPPSPIYTPFMSLYIVEQRYKFENHTFKKIQKWNNCLPDSIKGSEMTIIENEGGAIESLVKISSPFAMDITGSGLGGEGYKFDERGKEMESLQNGLGVGGPLLEGLILTEVEVLVLGEAFDPLPKEITSEFRSNQSGDLIWFTTPPSDSIQSKPLSHSFEYLYWKSQQGKIGFGGSEGLKRGNRVH